MTVGIDPAQVRDWFDGRDPVTTDGWVRLGAALLAGGRTDEARAVLRKTWVQGTFGKRQQRTFYKKYRKHLTKQDHIDRLERLLWKGHYWPVKRMLYRVGKTTGPWPRPASPYATAGAMSTRRSRGYRNPCATIPV